MFAGNPSRPSFAIVFLGGMYILNVDPIGSLFLTLVHITKATLWGVSFGHGVMVGFLNDRRRACWRKTCLFVFLFPVPFWRDKIESYKITIRVTSLSQPFPKKVSGIKWSSNDGFDSSLDPGEVLIYTQVNRINFYGWCNAWKNLIPFKRLIKR